MKNQGFTIAELMISLAILAVLAAIAIPAYSDYLNRARFSEGVIVTQKTLEDVFLYYQEHDTFPDNNTQLGIESMVQGSQISQIVVGSGGNVCGVFNGANLSGVMMLVPAADGSSTLLVDANLSKYAPNDAIAVPSAITPCESVSVSVAPTPTPTPTPSATASAAPVPTPSPTPSSSSSLSWLERLIAYLRSLLGW